MGGIPFQQTQSQYHPLHTATTATDTNFTLKIFNPANKKDYKLCTVRGVSPDIIDTPDKLKDVLVTQYGELLPEVDRIELGYLIQSKKMWINNRLDLIDAWDLVRKGERITFWSVGVTELDKSGVNQRKRSNDHAEESANVNEPTTKRKKTTNSEQKKALVEDFELKLQEKHKDKYTRFQIKLWAEMLSTGVHSDLDNPPAASMFGRDKHAKRQSEPSGNDTVVSQMMAVMNTLCQAKTPKPETRKKLSPDFSPVKRAELRGTYLKQLSELRQLLDQ